MTIIPGDLLTSLDQKLRILNQKFNMWRPNGSISVNSLEDECQNNTINSIMSISESLLISELLADTALKLLEKTIETTDRTDYRELIAKDRRH